LEKPLFCLTFLKTYIDTIKISDLNINAISDKVSYIMENYEVFINKA